MPLNIFKKFKRDTHASTAIEYALIAAVLGIALLSSGSTINAGIQGVFAKLAGTLEAAPPDLPDPGPPAGDEPSPPAADEPSPPAFSPPR